MSKGKSFTLRDIEQLAAQGLIRGYSEPLKGAGKGNGPKRGEGSAKGLKTTKRGQKIKNWIALNLWYFCQAGGFTLESEVVFHPERKWRADWMLTGKGLRVAVEYEGLMSEKSRHVSKIGYTGDTEKYTEMSKMGIICIRVTALNYKTLTKHLEDIENELKGLRKM